MQRQRDLPAVFILITVLAVGNLGAQDTEKAGLLFRPLSACTLLDSAAEAERLGPESRLLEGREEPCSPEGWGERVRAILVQVEAGEASALGTLKLWAGSEEQEPESGVLATSPGQVGQGLVLVDLCSNAATDAGGCSRELWARLEGGDAAVRLEVVGLFELPAERQSQVAGDRLEVAPMALAAPYWLEDANGIHFTDGRVGVGTALPEALFQVGSWETASTRYLLGGDMISMQGIEGKDRLPYLDMRGEDGARAFYLGWGSKANRVVDWKFENNYKLAIQGGKVGIGTTTPDAVLDVVGNFSVRNIPADDITPSNASINLYSREAGGTKHRWALHSASIGGGFGVVPNSLTIWEYDGRTCTSPSPVCHPRMVFEPNTGNVGIGTQDPQARLHVAGDLKIDGRLVSSGDICIGSCS